MNVNEPIPFSISKGKAGRIMYIEFGDKFIIPVNFDYLLEQKQGNLDSVCL